VAEGDPDRALYVIKSGAALVLRGVGHKDTEELTMLRRGDCFGEQSLLPRPTKRRTSIVASGEEPLIVLELSMDALAKHELLRPWAAELVEVIGVHALPGVDAAIAKRIENVNTRFPSSPGTRGDEKKRRASQERDKFRAATKELGKEGGKTVKTVARGHTAAGSKAASPPASAPAAAIVRGSSGSTSRSTSAPPTRSGGGVSDTTPRRSPTPTRLSGGNRKSSSIKGSKVAAKEDESSSALQPPARAGAGQPSSPAVTHELPESAHASDETVPSTPRQDNMLW